MKHTEISKTKGCWWKYLLLLWVTILGFAGFASAGNYPFPQNYQYPNGIIYTGTNVQSTLQSLYTTWKSTYYTESGNYARIKFVQSGESGTNTVSEGVAYGMLIFVYMDNTTNSTQDEFDKLWNYYKLNSNQHGLMNWKVNAFTGTVASGDGNANGATDADLDAAQALLMAHKQWGSTGTINYLSEAKTLISNIWTYEINANKYIKPGDAFDDYKNPCYFILNALHLFDAVEASESGWTDRDWASVITNSYSLIKKSRNASTGLVPDWCYENGSYLSGLVNSKFESIFGYDALRIPWRMSQAYAWYGDTDAYDIANTITTWCKGKYSDPSSIVDGYQLNGTPGTGGLGGSLSSWGTSSSSSWSGGLSMGAMVNSSNSDYLKKCWERGSATDYYGAYYTHTTQLLFMLCISGNMPNFWDMLPVAKSAETNSDGSIVYVTMSKAMSLTGLSTSTSCWTVKTKATTDDATPTSISVGSVSRLTDANGKYTKLQLNLTQEISEPYITLDYSCNNAIKSDDNAYAVPFTNLEVTNLITSMEPYPIARYTDIYGMYVYVQWSKEINASSLNKSDFTVKVDGTTATIESIALSADDPTVVALKLAEASYLTSSTQVVTVSFGGTSITSSTGTKKSKAFTNAPVQNYYMSVDCYTLNNGVIDNTGLAAGWTGAVTWSKAETDPTDATNTCMYFKGTSVAYGAARCQLTSTNFTNFTTAFTVAQSTVNGRIYLKSNPNNEDILIKFANYTESTTGGYYDSDERVITITASELTASKWVDISKTYNTPASQDYDMIVIQASGQNASAGTSSLEFYFDDFSICPPAPTVEAKSGKVSYDGYQVELRFTTGMKVPTDPSYITVKEGTTTKTVSKVETKTGDASVLVLTLAEPIASSSSTVTASVTTNLKSIDGRTCSAGTVTLANLIGITVATGWYDDFADATDYITLNLGGDGTAGHVVIGTEDATNSLIPITYDGAAAWSAPTIVTYSSGATDSHVVMDLTGHETASFTYKIASGTVSNLQCRIDLKDFVNDRASDGMSWQTLSTTAGWHTYSFDLSSTLFNAYGTSKGPVDATNIYQVLIYFRTGENAAYAPILPNATIQFDKISIGDALTLYDVTANATKQTVGVAENSSITGTSSADGYIYIVPFETTPQYNYFEDAVVNGKGVKVECTADVAATINLTGIGYGFFYAYAYDPIAGAISTKVPITINDVTAPIITDYYSLAQIALDASFATTVNEDATVYIFAKGADVSTEAKIATNALYSFSVTGGESVVNSMDSYKTKLPKGTVFQFVAVDASGNISAVVPTAGITVADVALTIASVSPVQVAAGTSISVTASRACTAYLVSSDQAVTLANVASVATSSKVITGISGSLATTTATEGYYYVYLVSSDGTELVGPSERISITKGTSYVTGLSLDYSAKTINVGENASFTITFDAADADDQTLDITGMGDWVTVAYDATKNAAGSGTITITGLASSAGAAIPITLTANGSDPNGTTVSTTISVTIVQKPTSITVTGTPTMQMSSTQQLTATVLPTTTDNKNVTWSSSDLTIATVSTSGLVTSLSKTGTVTITATSKVDGTILGTFDINVTSIAVTGLALSPSTLSLKTGATSEGAITLTVTPSNATSPGVTFTSSTPSVASVSYNSATNTITINGLSVGTTTITATSANGKTSNALTVTVTCGTAAPTASEVNPSQSYCTNATTATMTASFTDPNSHAVWYAFDPYDVDGQTPLYTGNSYDVAVGDLLTTYYVTKYENGCEGTTAEAVTPNATTAPTVAISGLETSYCASSQVITLKSSPTGATFTVDGAAATTLNLANLTAGNHTVIATMGTGTCVGTDTKTVTISAAPAVTITVDDAMCANDAAQTLTASPTGGAWTATGSGAAGLSGSTFSPASGSAVLNYTYVSGPCTVVKTAEVTVTDNPLPIISGLGSTYCSTDAAVTLSASPTGGSFTIDGTVATQFDPSKLSATSHNVVYTVLVNGCSGSATSAVTVNATPSIDLSSVPTTACAGVAVALTPTNGTWSGTGVSGTTFTSATAGNHEITYTETSAGCSASGAVTIVVTKATAPTVTPKTVELNAAVPALSASAAGTITWYADATTTTSLATGTTYTPSSISTAGEAVYTYYVSNTVSGCESSRSAVTLTVTGCTTPAPTIAEVAAICEGETFPTLTASGTGTSYTWYDAVTGGNILGTGATYIPTAAGTYYASQTVGCEGPRASVAVDVIAKPAAPTAVGASSCSGAPLVAMTTTESSNWYADQAGTALATSAKSYTPSSLTATTTFYVNQVVNGCTSDFAPVVYTIKATPATPVVTPTKACLGNTSDYNVVATAGTGATLQWYDANSSPKGTAATQVVSGVTTAKDYTYTVTQTISGCTSLPASATLTVNSLPVPTITNALTYCSNSAATVSLTADLPGGEFKIDGIVATSFVPQTLGVGTYQVTYTYTDANSCVGQATPQTIAIEDCSDPAITNITVAPTTLTLTVGDASYQLTKSLTPSTGTSNQEVSWTSSDDKVATVDNTGKVTAVAAGSATITVSSAYTVGKSATCAVIVNPAIVPITGASFAAGTPTTVAEGGTLDFSSFVTITPVGATNPTYVWTVENSTASTISTAGVLTAETGLTADKVIIVKATVTAGGVTKVASQQVTILKGVIPVSSIAVACSASMEQNKTYTAQATVLPANADNMTYTWSIQGTGATIDASGNITVIGTPGSSFTVVATANDASGVTGSAPVTIIAESIPVTSVAFNTNAYSIYASEQLDLSKLITVSPSTATIASTTWSITQGSSYATVSTAGVLTGIPSAVTLDKTVTVRVSVTGTDGVTKTASQVVTVKKDLILVKQIVIDNALTLEVGSTKVMAVNSITSNADNKTVIWSIKSGSGATIVAGTGEITVTGNPGDSFVVVATATDAGGVVSNECVVSVVAQTIAVTKIVPSLTTVEVQAGDVVGKTITVSYQPSNTTQQGITVYANTSVFSYTKNANGSITITGIQGGSATLTIRSDVNPNVLAEVTVNVTELVKNITINGPQSMLVGGVSQLSAVVGETTATNKTVSWTSSDPLIATVSSTGLVTALKGGLVTITATANDGSGVSSVSNIYISTIPVQTITASNVTLEIGSSATIKATIAPTNATYKTLTYVPADNSIISVDASGNISTIAEGSTTVTITAPQDGVSTTITVTVTPVKADKEYLIRLIDDEVWGAYAVYQKVQDSTIIIGFGKGRISPIVYNEFIQAWTEAQTVRYEDYATQGKVDSAATNLYNAIVAMGEKPTAIGEVSTIEAKVYPTKVTDHVTIEANDLISVKVVSATGKIVAQEEAFGDNWEINTSTYAQGVYKVVIETADGVIVKGFIK